MERVRADRLADGPEERRSMIVVLYFLTGLAVGYFIGSFIESILHEYVSDAPAPWVRAWRRHPRLFRVPLNTYFSHHVIHHHQTFRRNISRNSTRRISAHASTTFCSRAGGMAASSWAGITLTGFMPKVDLCLRCLLCCLHRYSVSSCRLQWQSVRASL
jgi:hypothetical protein